MDHRTSLVALAASVVIACFGFGAAPVSNDTITSSDRPLILDAAAPADRAPLMAGLDRIGVAKTLDKAGINVFGYVEGSYTYSTSSPPGGIITGRAFDFESEDPTLNQVNLTIERAIVADKTKWDVGFRIEQIFGGDARLIHSNGLTTVSPTDPTPLDVQYDLNQAYLTLNVPVGNGLLLTMGKFNTLLGYEVINPLGNPFYSHSFLFTQLPFTHTGVLANYQINTQWSAAFGITRGWDQFEDNNAAFDYTGQVKYVHDNQWTFVLNAITGPERVDNKGDNRTVLDLIAIYTASEKLSFVLNVDYGFEAGADPVLNKTAQWYGIATYAAYKVCPTATINGRLEWFNDQDGYRLGTGESNAIFEATVGVSFKPMPDHAIGKNLTIRPEVRVDYSESPFWDGGTDYYQWTFGVDAIFAY